MEFSELPVLKSSQEGADAKPELVLGGDFAATVPNSTSMPLFSPQLSFFHMLWWGQPSLIQSFPLSQAMSLVLHIPRAIKPSKCSRICTKNILPIKVA